MTYIDISPSKRIPIFLNMVKEMGRSEDPEQVLTAFNNAMSTAHGWQGYAHLSCYRLGPGEYRILRLVNGRADQVQRSDLSQGEFTPPVETGGLFGEIVGSQDPKLIHHLDLHDDPVLGNALSEFGSVIAVPSYYRGSPPEWILTFHDDPEWFTLDNLADALVNANMIGNRLHGVIVARELKNATDRIQREVDEIAAIQRAMLPQEMPGIPGLTVAANFETFDRAGGDYYDFLPLGQRPGGADPNGLWSIIIADASGHGPAATVVIAMLHSLLHSHAKEHSDPVALIERLNAELRSDLIRRALITAFLAIYDPATRTLRYVIAGHEAPLLINPKNPGAVRRLDEVRGFPLGVTDHVGSEEASVTLDLDDTIVLFTDGITEAQSPAGTQFQVEGIERTLRSSHGDPTQVIAELVHAVKEHEAGGRSRDDQTLVVLCAIPLP